MRIFVTGGSGFIGSRVVHTLLKLGHSVRCLLRERSKTCRIDGLDYEKHTGDIRDFDSLLPGLADCDAVIHLAGISDWTDIRSQSLEEVIVEGSRKLFEACLRSQASRCVYISSAAAINASSKPVVFNEDSPFELDDTSLHYAIAKHKVELAVLEYARNGLAVITVNPVEVYGPEDTGLITAGNILDIMKSFPALACTGGTAIAHVDDVADGIIRALLYGRSGERYILGGDNLTIEEIVRLTLSIAGQKKPVVKIPNRLLRFTMRAAAKMGIKPPVSPEVLDYATRYFFMDSSKAKRELGYKTRPAAEVLKPVVDWLRLAGYA